MEYKQQHKKIRPGTVWDYKDSNEFYYIVTKVYPTHITAESVCSYYQRTKVVIYEGGKLDGNPLKDRVTCVIGPSIPQYALNSRGNRGHKIVLTPYQWEIDMKLVF